MRRKTTLKIPPAIQVEKIGEVAAGTVPPVVITPAEDIIPLTTPPQQTKKHTQKKKVLRPVLSDTISAIPVASFRRMARIMANDVKSDLRWESDALEALQVAAEDFMVEKFQKAKATSALFSRKTLNAELLRA